MSYFKGLFGSREMRILILGLDGAGKTTLLYRLQVENDHILTDDFIPYCHSRIILFFQILCKSKCHILVTFPSHLKKLRSILRF